MITNEIIKLAKVLWDYHHVNLPLQESDCILVLGSHDTRVAERGAEIWLEKWAPLLIFSGGLGRLTQDIWNEPEARKFAKIAIGKGVPPKAILVEEASTNTGENIAFTQKIAGKEQPPPQPVYPRSKTIHGKT